MAIVPTIVAMAVAVAMAIGSIQKVGVSLSLPLAVVVTSTIQAIGGDGDGVLVDDGLPKAVGDDSASSDGQRSLASVVDLAVEGRGSEKSRHLMDGSLQVTVVTGDSLVASDSNWDSSVGSNNVGLNSGGDGLVGDLMCGRHHMGDGVGIAEVAKTSIGVASSERIAGVYNGSSSSLLSLPLAVEVTTIQAISGDGDGVLVDDWLASGVGDDSASSNGQRSLASVVDLAVEGGCREESRHPC